MSVQPQPQQPMSQEQLNQMLRRMVVGETHVQSLFGQNVTPQQQQQALQQIIDGAVAEAVTRAQILHQQAYKKLEEQFTGSQELLNEVYREHSLGQFFGKFGELKDHRQIVEDAIAEVSGRGDDIKDREDFFERVATASEGRIKTLKPDFALTRAQQAAAAAGQQSTAGAAPSGAAGQQQSPAAGSGASTARPPTYTGPSGSGASAGAAAGQKSPAKVSSIWDDPE